MYGWHPGWDFPREKSQEREKWRQTRQSCTKAPGSQSDGQNHIQVNSPAEEATGGGSTGHGFGAAQRARPDAGEPPAVEAHEWNHENNTFSIPDKDTSKIKLLRLETFFLLGEEMSVCRRFYSVRLHFFKISTLRINLFWFFRFCEPCLSENIPCTSF